MANNYDELATTVRELGHSIERCNDRLARVRFGSHTEPIALADFAGRCCKAGWVITGIKKDASAVYMRPYALSGV